MIPLVYAISHSEEADSASFQADGFTGVERHHRGISFAAGETLYEIVPPAQPGTSTVEIGHALHRQAEENPKREILLSNGGAFASPRELWQVLEAAHHPRVKIAWSAATARLTKRTAAMAVPTLNLRIGLVRLGAVDEEMLAYARRLAGIGFSGWIVIDPEEADGGSGTTPPDITRRDIAREMATAITAALQPRKPAKAVVKPKA